MAVVGPNRVGSEEEERQLGGPRDGELHPEGGGCVFMCMCVCGV